MSELPKGAASALKEHIIDIISEYDSTTGLDELVDQIIIACHSAYIKNGFHYNTEVFSSPFQDEELTQLIAQAYGNMFQNMSMAEIGRQHEVKLDFSASPLTQLTLGISVGTLTLIQNIWNMLHTANTKGDDTNE